MVLYGARRRNYKGWGTSLVAAPIDLISTGVSNAQGGGSDYIEAEWGEPFRE
jgi:hypothetical protein